MGEQYDGRRLSAVDAPGALLIVVNDDAGQTPSGRPRAVVDDHSFSAAA